MYLPVLLPLLLVTAVPPPSSLALLLPPEGNDYPLYDFPSLQYLPHNSLVEYHDPRILSDDSERMEVVTRSTYFPVPSSDSYSSSLYPPSSSSSSSSSPPPPPPPPCTRDDIASLLNMEDLDKVIRIVSMLEGKSVKEILLSLALKHGLHLKVPAASVVASVASASSSQPRRRRLPRALLVIADASSSEVASTEVALGPRMAVLDVLNEANSVFALNNGPYEHNPFAIKARRVGGASMCLGLESVGHFRASQRSDIIISVTRTRPLEQVVWESICLPRASQLLVRSGDVITLAPR